MSRLSVMPNYRKIQTQAIAVDAVETDLPAVDQEIMRRPEKLFVQSWSGNTEPIVIGPEGVESDGSEGGYELLPGGSMFLPGHIVDQWKAICASGGQRLMVTYLAEVY